MKKIWHEIRDPIHNFIKLHDNEKKILDTKAFQRLRNIHQLSLTYLVYPGATHKRFVHSLGVMELAGRVFEVVTNKHSIQNTIREKIPEIIDDDQKEY